MRILCVIFATLFTALAFFKQDPAISPTPDSASSDDPDSIGFDQINEYSDAALTSGNSDPLNTIREELARDTDLMIIASIKDQSVLNVDPTVFAEARNFDPSGLPHTIPNKQRLRKGESPAMGDSQANSIKK